MIEIILIPCSTDNFTNNPVNLCNENCDENATFTPSNLDDAWDSIKDDNGSGAGNGDGSGDGSGDGNDNPDDDDKVDTKAKGAENENNNQAILGDEKTTLISNNPRDKIGDIDSIKDNNGSAGNGDGNDNPGDKVDTKAKGAENGENATINAGMDNKRTVDEQGNEIYFTTVDDSDHYTDPDGDNDSFLGKCKSGLSYIASSKFVKIVVFGAGAVVAFRNKEVIKSTFRSAIDKLRGRGGTPGGLS